MLRTTKLICASRLRITPYVLNLRITDLVYPSCIPVVSWTPVSVEQMNFWVCLTQTKLAERPFDLASIAETVFWSELAFFTQTLENGVQS